MILNRRSYFLFIAGGALIIGGLLLLFLRGFHIQKKSLWQNDAVTEGRVQIGETILSVRIARTEAAHERGLSGTPSLPENTGMLFTFSEPGMYGFWMKDMQYPIDIVWVSSEHRIVAVSPSLRPDTYPTIFYPPEPVQFVLEVPAGFSTAHLFAPGQEVQLQEFSS